MGEAKLIFTDLPSASFLMIHGASDDAEKLISRLKRASIGGRVVKTDIKLAVQKAHRRRRTCSSLAHSARLEILRNSNRPKFKPGRFFRTAPRDVDITRILKFPHASHQLPDATTASANFEEHPFPAMDG